MSHRYVLAAVMLGAFALPAAAQSTTQSDTSKKAIVNTSNGAVTDTSSATTTVNPNGTPSNGAVVTPTPQPSAGPASTPPKEAAAEATGATPTTGSTTTATPATGMAAAHEAAKVNVKVAQSVASTVKISGDSAFAIARTSPDSGEVSSADLEMAGGRLVYQVKMLHTNKGASEVVVDAMTGQILKDKKYGGLKAMVEHHDENKKLLDAKRDSTMKSKP